MRGEKAKTASIDTYFGRVFSEGEQKNAAGREYGTEGAYLFILRWERG